MKGRYLRTRVGINTGDVLAGNLGSRKRFDYTAIGDATNFAARLEGLNKHLGTDILIGEATQRQVGNRFRLRDLGNFKVKGKQQAVRIYEVLGYADAIPGNLSWLKNFAAGLSDFRRGDLTNAETRFRETIAERGANGVRGGHDGPSHFYLERIAQLREHPVPEGSWDGSVQMDAK
jgi:adenylate cyclase